MNEYARDFQPVWDEIKDGSDVVGLNGTEYIELLEAAGVKPEDYPICQAVGQHKIWVQVNPDKANPDAVAQAIKKLKPNDPQFHIDGASWTNDLSWVRGYENVLEPMNQLSAMFHQKYDKLVAQNPTITQTDSYLEALLYVLLLETSCFRYWGQGTWTNYARDLYYRGERLLK